MPALIVLLHILIESSRLCYPTKNNDYECILGGRQNLASKQKKSIFTKWSSVIVLWKVCSTGDSVKPFQIWMSEPFWLILLQLSQRPSEWSEQLSLLFVFKHVLGQVRVFIQLLKEGCLASRKQLVLLINLKVEHTFRIKSRVINTYHWKYGTSNLKVMLGFWHKCNDRSKPTVKIKMMSNQ